MESLQEVELGITGAVESPSSFMEAEIATEQSEVAAFLPDSSSKVANKPKPEPDIVVAMEYMFGVFALYSMRIPALLLLPWLWNLIGIEYFIPVVSPVYREGEHWQAPHKRAAIVLHICFGSAMLILGLFQADQTFRHKHKWWHRMMGRAYIACGLVTIGSLQVLQDSVGAGSGGTPSVALAWFVNATSVGWIVATFCGVMAARSQRIELHRICMRASLLLAATPIAQRMFSWLLCAPLGMAARIFLCSSGFGQNDDVGWDFVHIRWGASNDTLWGGGCLLDDDMYQHLIQNAPRDRPYVLSADGYGEGEQLTFGMSAWMGLIGLSLVSLMPVMVKAEKAALLHKAMSEASTLDLMRRIYLDVTSVIAENTAHRTAVARFAVTVGLIGAIGVAAGFAAVAAGGGIVVFTLGVTMIVLAFSLGGATIFLGFLHISAAGFHYIFN